MQNQTQPNYGFDEFRLDVPKRQLLRRGVVVQLNPKAFDLLFVLVESAGRVLSKDDLFERVWEDQIVEESNLTVNISAIRRALGENAKQPRFITTVSGEGYCFVGNVRELADNGREFVVESHTVSRIVVEQEEIDDNSISLPAAGRPTRNRMAFAVILGVLLAAGVGVGGYFLLRAYQTRPSNSMAAASIKKLTNGGRANYAALSPDNKLFAFATREGKTSGLWLGYIDGGEPIQIRPSAEMFYLSVRFSPDGSSLYYVSSENFRRGDLYRIPVFGGAPEKLRDNVRGNVTFAPDGKRMAFVRSVPEGGQQSLMVTDLLGSNEEIIAEPPANFSFIAGTVVWSPNSEIIAIGAGSDGDHLTSEILIANAANKTINPLPTEKWYTINGLTWLHDGGGLIVAAREKDALANQLWHVSYPGGEKHRVVTDLNNYGGSISLSADDKNILAVQVQVESNIWAAPADDLSKAKQLTFGSPGQNNGWNGLDWVGGGKIVYSKQVNNNIGIWSANADGGGQKQLVPGGGSNIMPTVPADQKYVVFQSDRSGNPAIWRTDIDGGNLTQLTGAGIAAQPRVSPDGKWIFYVSDLGDVGDLWRMTIDGGDPKRLGDTQFSWVGVSPDSKLLAGGYIENGKPKLGVMSIDGGNLSKSFDVPRLANFRLGVHWTADGQAVTYRDWANGIWKQAVSGGDPELIKDLPEEKLYGYAWSPDGKRFAYARGAEIVDVVWISGLHQF